MSLIPVELKYSDSHEWVRTEGDGTITVGLTGHATKLLGGIVGINVNTVGQTLGKDSDYGYVEGGRGADSLYMPIDGEILGFNSLVADQPDSIDSEPYGDGWVIKIKPTDPKQLNTLLSASAYAKLIGA